MLFERATFLVISHATETKHTDIHRFEKISNIIKQFKLSVMKTRYEFKGMMVRLSGVLPVSWALPPTSSGVRHDFAWVCTLIHL